MDLHWSKNELLSFSTMIRYFRLTSVGKHYNFFFYKSSKLLTLNKHFTKWKTSKSVDSIFERLSNILHFYRRHRKKFWGSEAVRFFVNRWRVSCCDGMRTRSATPLSSPSQHEATKCTASNIALSSRKRLPWWLQAVMRLWRVLRSQHQSRGSGPSEQGNDLSKGVRWIPLNQAHDELTRLIILWYWPEQVILIGGFKARGGGDRKRGNKVNLNFIFGMKLIYFGNNFVTKRPLQYTWTWGLYALNATSLWYFSLNLGLFTTSRNMNKIFRLTVTILQICSALSCGSSVIYRCMLFRKVRLCVSLNWIIL